ncbi:hypothetical protein AYO42_00665 [Rhizomicrobium sp. SCGC AG-212-E05]|nr:hypothetical protein AYO42_00665 [Rhizomicrobium sp. SCGC AG-212-E05]
MPILKELELVAKQSWRLILGCAAFGFVIAALNLQGAVYTYPVEMQVTTAQSTGGGGGGPSRSSGGFAQLSGLASLANIALPSTQNEIQFQLFIESMRSRDLANDIAKNHDIMVALYGDQWDPITQTWHEPPAGKMAGFKLWLRGLLGLAPTQPWHAPNGENIQGFLSSSLQLIQDPRKTYMLTLKLTSGSRDFSIKFLNVLVKTADERLRRKAVERAQTYINYLTAKLATVTVSEHRDALTQSLGEQERYAMVASSGKPFAAEVFQSPWASNLPESPSPRQTFLTWILLSAAGGTLFAFLRHRYQAQLRRSLWLQRLPAFVRRPLEL